MSLKNLKNPISLLLIVICMAACSSDDTEVEVIPEPEPIEEAVPEPVPNNTIVRFPPVNGSLRSFGEPEIVPGSGPECNPDLFKTNFSYKVYGKNYLVSPRASLVFFKDEYGSNVLRGEVHAEYTRTSKRVKWDWQARKTYNSVSDNYQIDVCLNIDNSVKCVVTEYDNQLTVNHESSVMVYRNGRFEVLEEGIESYSSTALWLFGGTSQADYPGKDRLCHLFED